MDATTDNNPGTVTPTNNGGNAGTPPDNGGNKVTPTNNGGNGTNAQPDTNTNGADNPTNTKPFKAFQSQEEFDKYSAGISHNAQSKAEKEILALLGLKPNEKEKLAKFKDAYESTLSEAEKQAKTLETLNAELVSLKAQIAEKDAVISALSRVTGKNSDDVGMYVRMAKGLVDDNTTIDQAIEKVLTLAKGEEKKQVPTGKPLSEPNNSPAESNPFKDGNLTKQGELIKSDRVKAREMYFAVYGKAPSW